MADNDCMKAYEQWTDWLLMLDACDMDCVDVLEARSITSQVQLACMSNRKDLAILALRFAQTRLIESYGHAVANKLHDLLCGEK